MKHKSQYEDSTLQIHKMANKKIKDTFLTKQRDLLGQRVSRKDFQLISLQFMYNLTSKDSTSLYRPNQYFTSYEIITHTIYVAVTYMY